MSYFIFIDGASRGNPGSSGAGIVIYYNDELLEKISKYLGKITNNQAEYNSLLLALKYLKDNGIKKANIYSDSSLLVNQLEGKFKVKSSKIKPLYDEAITYLDSLEISFFWIPREKNKIADHLANLAIDEKSTL